VSYRTILYDVDERVATITMNRPAALNAISRGMEAELMRALDAADRDPDVRAIILTGSGKAFSSGYDMTHADDAEDQRHPDRSAGSGAEIGWWQRRLNAEIDNLLQIMRLGKPVIAAVNGYCMGGGFFYQLACDITIASDRALFAQPEVRQVSSTTFLFPALAGWKSANRYSLTGDHFDAQEALRIGVVNQVVPHDELEATTRALARRISLVPEASVRLNKAIAMQGLLAAGIASGLLLNGTLSAMAHSSHGPETERLSKAFHEGGMRAFLKARDDPFLPEPFGPRADRRPV
jgi:enoyl-CoA hydratase/carnithine racemase